MYDCAIIGAGAAGVSAALTLKALHKNFIWFGAGGLSAKIRNAERIDNFPGLPAVSGAKMAEIFSAQTAAAGIEISKKRVTGIYPAGEAFEILCDTEVFTARTVILATGVEAVKPIAGELDFLGRGVSYCATCDGALYRGKTIAVVCTEKEQEHEIEFLATLAQKLYLIPLYKNPAVQAKNVETLSGAPLGIAGGLRAEKLLLKDSELAVDGIFMLKAAMPSAALVNGLQTENGHVVINRACETNIKGLFAAGDCTGRPYQYVKAAGEGNVAAHGVHFYLAKKP
jgi:thioredoxin reductase (NADPH)